MDKFDLSENPFIAKEEKTGIFNQPTAANKVDFSKNPFMEPEPTDKSALGALGKTLLRVPENIVAQGIGAVQGQTGASVTDAGPADKLYNWVQQRNEQLSREYEGAGDTIIPGISKQDVAQLGPNLAFSGISLGASLVGSIPGGGPESPVGAVGAMAAGGLAAHRMQSYQTMNDWLQRKNEESKKQFGRGINPDEEKAFRAKFEALATEGGLWEAGPEAINNVLDLALMMGKGTLPGKIAAMLPKGLAGKAIKESARIAGILGSEEATETITQMGQHNVEVKAGMSEDPMRSWTSGEDWLTSAKEVLPSVLLLTGFMGAGGAMYRKYKSVAGDEMGEAIEKAQEALPTEHAAIQTKPSEYSVTIPPPDPNQPWVTGAPGAFPTNQGMSTDGDITNIRNTALGVMDYIGKNDFTNITTHPDFPDYHAKVAGLLEQATTTGAITDKEALPIAQWLMKHAPSTAADKGIAETATAYPVGAKIKDAEGNTGTVTGHKRIVSETSPVKVQVSWDNAKPGQLPLSVDPGKISLAQEVPQTDTNNIPEVTATNQQEAVPVKEELPPAADTAAATQEEVTPAKPEHLMTHDEYVQAQVDAMSESEKQTFRNSREVQDYLERQWITAHSEEVKLAQERGEIIPPEVLASIPAEKQQKGTGEGQPGTQNAQPGATSQAAQQTQAGKGLPGKRSWYDFKDLKREDLTPEESDRIWMETGPTAEETAEWNTRQAEVGKRQAEKSAADAVAEQRQAEVIRRANEGRAKSAPDMHVSKVAAKIEEIRRTKGQHFTPSEYAQAYADAVGVPNHYAFLAKIADKLGIKVFITDESSASKVVKTDGVYDMKTNTLTISPKMMVQVPDQGPGYGIAHGWETMIHEMLHGIVRKSPNWKASRKRLLEFRASLIPYMEHAPKEVIFLMNHVDRYDIDELIAEAFTNHAMAQWLDSIPAEGVKNPSKTMWGKLKDIIMKALETFGLPKSKLTELNEILDQVLPVEMAEEAAPKQEDELPAMKENQYGTPEKINTVNLSEFLRDNIDATYGKIDKNMVKKWVAEAFGITGSVLNELEKTNRYDHKGVEEAFEYAMVREARSEIARAGSNLNNLINRFIEMYNNQPNLASRTSESTIMQQYSTPLPIAWLMNKFLGLTGKAERTVYEPTAGNGMLLIGARAKDITANELDKGARLTHLKDFIKRYGGMVTSKNAAEDSAGPGLKTQDRVIMNPPFGKAAERAYDGYKLTKLEHQIVVNALRSMKDNGKAAFIIGGHNIKDTGNMTGTDKTFFNYLYNHYNVTHNIDINGDLYARQGTKFPIRLITIEGRKATPDTGFANYTGIEPADTFLDIRDILDRRVADEKSGRSETENRGKEGADTGPEGGGSPNANEAGANGNSPGGQGVGGAKLPGKSGSGRGSGEGNAGKRGGERQGDNGVQQGETSTGKRGEVSVKRVDGSDVSGVTGQNESVPGSKSGEQSAGVKDDFQKAVDELSELFMPFEANKTQEPFDEKIYEQAKPRLKNTVEQAINKHGFDITDTELRDHFKASMEPGKFWRALQYIRRYLDAEFLNIKAALKSGLGAIFQKQYAPRSKGQSGNTLIPKNQEQSLQAALDKVEAAHGNIDQWVMKELKYPDTQSLYDAFSAEQIDALALAIENIGSNNAGFILGDQTGVGKGRVVAGMIRYANMNGKIPIFVTAQANLFTDMYRDLRAINHAIKPFIMNSHSDKLPANIVNQATGEVIHFASRPSISKKTGELKGSASKKRADLLAMDIDPNKFLEDNDFKAVFTTYSQHNKDEDTLKDNIILNMVKDNIIILDESHKAAGASKVDIRKGTSNTNRRFIRFLDQAQGVLYSSATYAKAPANMVLYFRTVLGDAGISMRDLLTTIENGGVPFQEYLSNIIAKMGQYMRRELDFKGINYNRTLTMDKAAKGTPEADRLTKEFEEHKKIADSTNERVQDISESDRLLKVRYRRELEALLLEKFGVAMSGKLPDKFDPNITSFTSLLHNIEQQLLSSIKVEKTLAEAKLAIDKGQKVVIAFDNTMESFLNDTAAKGQIKVGDPINFSFRSVLERALDNCLKFTAEDATGEDVTIRLTIRDLEENIPEAGKAFRATMERIQQYSQNLHASPIDFLRSELQKHTGKPVYELTGRKHMIDYDGENGKKVFADRNDPNRNDTISAFNSGKIDVLILNKSGSEGLSLHTSPDFKDTRQRKMLIHQADRDINVFMQILGRVNRKGQLNLPEYLDIVTSLPAELRPVTLRERKLASLNANTTSSQEGAERSKENPDMMNLYGDKVTRDYLAKNPELAMSIGLINTPNESIPNDDSSTYAKVSGKIAVLPVEAQKEFFDDIDSMYRALIDEVNARGENELISKDYDFQAKTMDKRMLVSETGVGEGARANPLMDAVNIEKMQVRMLNKPHNIVKLTQLITDVLGIKTEKITEGKTEKKTQKELRDEIISKRDSFAKEIRDNIKKAVDEHFAAWQAKLPEKYDNPDTIARVLANKETDLQRELDLAGTALSQFKLGSTYTIPAEADSNEKYTGVLTNILWSPGAGNPVQPAKIKFVFSLNDPKQTAMRHAGQVWNTRESLKIDNFIPDNWNDDLPQEKHEPAPRYIITGSMLKAHMVTPSEVRFEMISFTRENGQREFGLLVPKKIEDAMWGHRPSDTMKTVQWQQAVEYVSDNVDAGERFVSTANGLITIQKKAVRQNTKTGLYENEYMVNVPSSAKEGAQYYQDKDLMALVRGGNFRKQSTRMLAVVEPANIAAFLKILQDKHNITFRIPSDKQQHMPFEAAEGSTELYMPFVPAAVTGKIGELTDILLNRPQTIPKADLKAGLDVLKNQENFKTFDRYFGLPWWNAQKYKAWKLAFDIFGIRRPEMRGNLMHQFAIIAEPFLKLDANMKQEGFTQTQIQDAKTRIQKIIIAGDALLGKEVKDLERQYKQEEKLPDPDRVKMAQMKARIDQIRKLNRYSDEELRDGIKNEYGETIRLNDREAQVYTSVRSALDNMFDTYSDHLAAQAFRSYSKNKWYAILCQAAGVNLQKDATAKLIRGGLNAAALTYAQRIQPSIHNIFEKIDDVTKKTKPEDMEVYNRLKREGTQKASEAEKEIFERVEKELTETSEIEKKMAGDAYGVLSKKLAKEITLLQAHLKEILKVNDQEAQEATRSILAAYIKTKPEMKRVKSLRNLYKKQIAFFPRVREQGNHKLHLVEHIYDKDGSWIKDRKIHSEMFTGAAEFKAMYAKYMTKYGKDGKLPANWEILTPEAVVRTPEMAFQGVNDINMQKILDDAIDNMKIKEGNWAEKLRQAGYSAIAGQFQSRGWGQHLRHRQWNVIKGYEENDLQKILFNYLSGMSGIMTKQVAASDFLEMMKDVKEPSMFESLSKYGKDQLRNSTSMDKVSQKARSFMFTWYLGGILRPAVVQLTQNFVTGIPAYASYLRENKLGGAGKADILYMAAMKDIAGGKMNDNKNLTDTEQRLQKELFTDGITQDQYIQQIFGGLGDKFDQTSMKALRWLAMPFSFMEQFNRQAAALTMFRSAYKLASKEIGTKFQDESTGQEREFTAEDAYQKAFGQARDFVYNTHYAMDKANLPQLAQGGDFASIGVKTLYTFRSFTHNFVLWQKNNLTSGDWRAMMHSLAYMALFGGLMGLPFFKDLFEWIEKQFGYSPTKAVRTALRETGGRTLETFGFSGLPAVLGANISGSLALGIPGMGETPQDTVYGVYGGFATKVKRAGEAAGRGDWYRFGMNLAPEFMRNPAASMMESEYGKALGMPGYASTTKGRAVYGEDGKPIQMSPGESLLKFTGFNPTENARQKEQNQVIKRQEEWGQEAKRDLSETYRIEKANRDPKAMQHLMTGVKELNAEIRDRGIQKIVPLVSVSTIVKNSRDMMNKKQRKEIAYKQSAL